MGWTFGNESVPADSWNDPAQAYSGCAYVEWVGIDGYNWGSGHPGEPDRQPLGQLRVDLLQRLPKARSIASNKPVTIDEIASSEDGGNKAAWITDMSAQLKSGNYPRPQADQLVRPEQARTLVGTSQPPPKSPSPPGSRSRT